MLAIDMRTQTLRQQIKKGGELSIAQVSISISGKMIFFLKGENTEGDKDRNFSP